NLEFEEDGSESFVEADKILLKRAIENLVINALIHNPEDTKVCVGVESASDDTVKIIVKDNGRGMSEKEVSRLFDRYYRGGNTSQKTGGTGLGMAIARQIIEQSGGRVEVMSKVAEGTIITVYMRKAQ
ncbi:MAG: ATP-binding protein, partial [Lachnospiraceae bacterium]|nr:ATP-binding protein [Lachnospiraceae bacterium]